MYQSPMFLVKERLTKYVFLVCDHYNCPQGELLFLFSFINRERLIADLGLIENEF